MRIFYFFILLFGIVCFSSCVSDDDTADGTASITVSADTAMAEVGDTFTFTVRTDSDEDVTSASTITLNNTIIDGHTFTPAEKGAYKVKASYNNLVTTTDYEVVAIDRKPSSIEVATDSTTLNLGEVFSFTVMTDVGVDVTYESTIEVDGEPLERERFKPETPGIYTVTAIYNGLESPPLEVEAAPNTISVIPDQNEILLGETFTFTVLADSEIDITSESTIKVNGNPIEGNGFTPEEGGTYTITATYGELTGDPVEVTVSTNFFVLDNTLYETPTAIFAYLGTFQGEESLQSVWVFNPYLQVDNGYPNDVYIYLVFEQPEDGDLVFPSEGSYSYSSNTLPNIIDAEVYYNDVPWIDGAPIEDITLDIVDMNDWILGTTEVGEISYTITKTDGTTVTGQYSGSLSASDSSGKGTGKDKKPVKGIQLNKSGNFSKIR
ncbi:hypothetical protein LS482_10640 [Sinomicrobium kalidii]|uniref:hypothetical protein n=1 Tax=Sinomicrobium kalidii TaxID=2900738 RepID=UPI001E2EB4AE|nr:hypothetical protein [Sinomicrobium kalidii]UGU18322.1 hypothetical protein LS482_10640 [Sinomicrobium kalidii]